MFFLFCKLAGSQFYLGFSRRSLSAKDILLYFGLLSDFVLKMKL